MVKAAGIGAQTGVPQNWWVGTSCQPDFKCKAHLERVTGVLRNNCASREVASDMVFVFASFWLLEEHNVLPQRETVPGAGPHGGKDENFSEKKVIADITMSGW